MARFQLKFIRPDGSRGGVAVEAADRASAVLRRPPGTTVVGIEEELLPGRGARIPAPFLLELTETLRLLSEAGLDTSDALELAAEIFGNHRRGSLVEELRRSVAGGGSLSAALAAAGVPSIYSALVHIGESIGGLALVLPALSDYLTARKTIREKFVSAIIYPLFILTVLFLGGILILTFVAPRIIATLETMAVSDAGLTATVARMDLFLTVFGVSAAVICVLPAVITLCYRFVPGGASFFDAVFLKIPGIGGFVRTADLMNLTYALEALTGAGVLLEQAVNEATPVVGNRALRRQIAAAGALLMEGASPSAAFGTGKDMPQRFIRWLAIGERTGTPEKVFSGLKQYYRHEYEKSLTRLTGLIEPVLILVTGALLFAAVLVFVLPLYSWYGDIL